MVIAGFGANERQFRVHRSALEQSIILKDWLEAPDSMSDSTAKEGALFLGSCDPEAVRVVLNYLEKEAGVVPVFDFEGENALLNAKVFKLALSLS